MRPLARLFWRYVVRDLVESPLRTVLAILGVALGISVVVAVQISNDRAIDSFNQSLSVMNGRADLQIQSNGSDLDERVFGKLGWLWREAQLSPIVEGRGRLDGVPVRILGVDLISEGPFRDYFSSDGRNVTLDISQGGFLELLTEVNRVLLPTSLAEELGIQLGAEVEILADARPQKFKVGALLQDRGAGRAFGGKVVFMDIATAQESLGRLGALDRIDVVLRSGRSVEDVSKRLRERLPPNAVVYRPEDLSSQSERMLRGFRFNLTALSYLALIVGVILIYNTLNISVVRRKREVAALRTVGTSRRAVFVLLLGEAALLGAAGAVGGVALGVALSEVAESLVRRTVENLYTGALANFDSGPAFGFLFALLPVGILLGVVSGWVPARRATSRPPIEVLREGFLTTLQGSTSRWSIWLALALLAVAAALARGGPVQGVPLLGYAAAIALMSSFAFIARPVSASLLRLTVPHARGYPVVLRLALQTVEGGLGRLIVAVTSLMIAVSMLVAVAIMVGSFRETVIVWIDQTLNADFYVRPAGSGPQDWSTTIDTETVDALSRQPGVDAVGRFRGRAFTFDGATATLAGGHFEVLGKHDHLIFLDGRTTSEVASRMPGHDRVVITEPFSLRHGILAGDTIPIPTPSGVVDFQVEAVYYDYSSDRGAVVMDRERYIYYFGDDSATSLSIYLQPSADSEVVWSQIRSSAPAAGLQLFRNADLKRTALRVFDQTFRITYALELIAIIVAVLGITNTLAALLLERRGEIALLRFLGASTRQIRSMAILESGIIGVLGAALGTGLGVLLSFLLIFVINRQSFGWTIQLHFPIAFVSAALGLIVVSTLIAGSYPASQAARTDPIRSLRAE